MSVVPITPIADWSSERIVMMLLELNRVSFWVHGGQEATIQEAMIEIFIEIDRRGEMGQFQQEFGAWDMRPWQPMPSLHRRQHVND